jgi:iron complex transport system substrate-binding protein
MKRTTILLLALILLLAACAPLRNAASTGPAIVITDARGRTVKLTSLPQRIVITGKGLFMIADAAYLFPEASQRIVGLGDAGQGTSKFLSWIDPHYGDKTILSSGAGAEQIAALHPDLVILKSYVAATLGATIEALGLPVIYVDFETPEQYSRDVAILGEVFGDPARAAEVSTFYQSRIDSIRQAIRTTAKPRTLLLYYDKGGGSVAFNVPPLNWMQTQMVQLAGGEPIWVGASLGNGWTQVTLEQIAAWDADDIFIVSYDANSADVVAGLKTDVNWQALRAVKEGHLHAFAGDLYSWDQPDPRWILGLTWLAGKLHPDLFPSLDMTAEARTFYASLYGLDAASFDANILPTFKGDLP